LVVNVYSDNAQMTSKRGKNKEVRYEQQARSETDVLTTFATLSRRLCVTRVTTASAKWNILFLYIALVTVIPHKIRNVFRISVLMIFVRRTLRLIVSFVCLYFNNKLL